MLLSDGIAGQYRVQGDNNRAEPEPVRPRAPEPEAPPAPQGQPQSQPQSENQPESQPQPQSQPSPQVRIFSGEMSPPSEYSFNYLCRTVVVVYEQ